MFLEVHILQNYPYSNLNRDDTGAPKSCDFGGVRRARISSQCLKRAIRTYVREQELLPSRQLSYRTKLFKEALFNRLLARQMDPESADSVASSAIKQIGLKLDGEKTQYLLLLGEVELDRLATIAHEHQETLLGNGTQKDEKEARDLLLAALDGGGAVDLALFGRMIADRPDKNVDAATQMAHALSTHAVATEFDFYSAVDDLQRDDSDEGAGAGMLGTTLYQSACYYRYANVDLRQLESNLGKHSSGVASAVKAFLAGMIHAVPSGKQTASAAQNPPSLIFVLLRERNLWSLANAFVNPVRATAEQDVVSSSARALFDYFQKLVSIYGDEGIHYAGTATYLENVPIPEGVTVENTGASLIASAANGIALAAQ